MSLETEIRTRLADDGTIAGLVSTRIYPQKLPQSPTYPALVYQTISDIRDAALDGDLGSGQTRLQITSWDDNPLDAQTLADAVRSSLHGFSGKLTTLRVGIRKENEVPSLDDTVDVYGRVQDYIITHTE